MMKPIAVPVRAGLLLALLASVGVGAHAASDTATATAVVLTPMTITKNTDLVFGNLVAGNGIVTVATDDTRTKAGGTVLPSGVTATAAKFTIGGTAGQGYSISYAGTDTDLTSGSDTMAFTYFAEALDAATPSGATSGQPATFTPAGATSYLYVGGTVTVGPSQPAGTYTGSVIVTVDYN